MAQTKPAGSKPGKLGGADFVKIAKGAALAAAAAALTAIAGYLADLDVDGHTAALVAVVAVVLNVLRKLVTNTEHYVAALVAFVVLAFAGDAKAAEVATTGRAAGQSVTTHDDGHTVAYATDRAAVRRRDFGRQRTTATRRPVRRSAAMAYRAGTSPARLIFGRGFRRWGGCYAK